MSNNCCNQTAFCKWIIKICKIGLKTTETSNSVAVTTYYVTVVFDLPCESEYRFTMYPNPDSLIEYPLDEWSIHYILHRRESIYLTIGWHICPFPWSICSLHFHLIHDSFDHESTSQMPSGLVQPFLHNHITCDYCSNRLYLLTACRQ